MGRIFWGGLRGSAAAAAIAALLIPAARAQHITIDGTLSPAQTLAGPNYTIGANLGKQVGGNLFQSFGRFGLGAGESADFTGPAGIANIIGRVTGGSPSAIDGRIQSSIAGASLYLINPFGVVFGANATVNIGGSFHAATADYLRLADGARFQASHPDGSTFSAAPPAAFGFLSPAPAAIAVNGAAIGPVPGTLGLVGGPVTIAGGNLTAPGGTIRIASAAGPGEVPVDPAQPASVASFGPVAISGGSRLDAGSGGSVLLRAGSLSLDASAIAADTSAGTPGGQIRLQVDDQLALSDGAVVHAATAGTGTGAAIDIDAGALTLAGPTAAGAAPTAIVTTTSGAGSAGAIGVRAGSISLSGLAQIGSTSTAIGASGDVAVVAAEALSVDATGAAVGTTIAAAGFAGIRSAATAVNGGGSGSVSVSAGTLLLRGGGLVGTSIAAARPAGDVTVAVAGLLTLETLGGIAAESPGVGAGGSVRVGAHDVAIGSGGSIYTDAALGGHPGDVSVTIAGSLTIDGTAAPAGYRTGILSETVSPSGAGNAGNVTVVAGAATLIHGGVIFSQSAGSGRPGAVAVSVGSSLAIDGTGAPDAGTGITAAATSPQSTGAGGSVTVTAAALSIVNNGQIASHTSGGARAGDVSVTVGGSLTIDGSGAVIEPQGTQYLTGIASEAEPKSTGAAGAVTVRAGALTILANGQITTSTFGSGNAGQVAVTVGGPALIDGAGAAAKQLTGIDSDSEAGASGNAGTVTFAAAALTLRNGGEISSSVLPASNELPASRGNAGSVAVTVAGGLTIDGANANGAAGIGTSTGADTTGQGGNVTIAAGALTIADHGQIATNTSGSGDGGSIVVTAGSLSIASNGQIAGGTLASGNGGNIDVAVNGPLIIDAAGAVPDVITGISAQANPGATGNAGTVTVSAARLLITAGGSIATSAPTANGGDLAVAVGGLVFLFKGGITTSVSQQFGNGGNIAIAAPQLVLDAGSQIFAQAFRGHGGNIAITGAEFVPSDDSLVSASSALGISGTVEITGPRVDLNGALVTLSGNLHAAAPLLRSSCGARRGPRSSLAESGRGGLPQSPEAGLPALYLAGREPGARTPPEIAAGPLRVGLPPPTPCG